jgi:hypothetical protein
MKRIILILCLLPSVSMADMTGAGDAAIVQQLIVMVEAAYEQLEQLEKATNISKRIEEMETVKSVKKVSEQGNELKKLMSELEKTGDLINEMGNNPGGINDINQQIGKLEDKLNVANNKEGLDKAKAYSRLLADLKRIRFLRDSNTASIKEIAGGTNDEDNKRLSAHNSTIMTDLLIRQEEKDSIKRSHETQAVSELLDGISYGSMAKGGIQ